MALDRIRAGRSARSFILYGLRGVGKTVLLNRVRLDAEARGIISVKMEAPEERSLPALLIPALRAALLRLSRGEALAELDASFFRVRFDRLTPGQKRYLRAMAELGAGPHRSGEIADMLKKKVTMLAPVRSLLIAKGMLYSPAHGDTAFTVPLFEGFMRRIMRWP